MNAIGRLPASIPCSTPLCLCLAALLFGPVTSIAGSITCGAPKSAGNLNFDIYNGVNKLCSVQAVIPANAVNDDTLKAEIVKKAIEKQCKDVVSATRAVGSNQVVIKTAAGGDAQAKEKLDTTGERNTYAMAWGPDLGQLCSLDGPASGLSYDGVSAGSVTVGTGAWTTTVPTSPGETAGAVLATALSQLNAHGVSNVSLVSLGPNEMGLLFHLTDPDSLIWGCDDGAMASQFQALQDSIPVSADPAGGMQNFFVVPGAPTVTIQLDPAPLHAHTEVTLYGYDPSVRRWGVESYWSIGDAPAQFEYTPRTGLIQFQLQLSGDHGPITGVVTFPAAPMAQTPSTPMFAPGFSVGWTDDSGGEFNPTLGQGGGNPTPIVLQPGLSLNNVPMNFGANHWAYIPLQLNPQVDPSRPWLYLNNNPSQGYAEHTWVSLHLTTLYDPLGSTISQLPIVIGLAQGANQSSTTVTAFTRPDGEIVIPPVDLGALLVQPFTLAIGVGSGSTPNQMTGASVATLGPAGFATLDAINVLTTQQVLAAGVPGDDWRGTLSFALPLPNPCLLGTRLRFGLPRSGPVRLQIFDPAGRRVRTLADGALTAGIHDLSWDARNEAAQRVSGGIYFARLEAEGSTETRKIVVLR